MKIYISGPISDMPDLNRAAFYDAADKFKAAGFETFNPHTIEPPDCDDVDLSNKRQIWQYYMRECVKELPNCQHIYMLQGWVDSEGARWEFNLAMALGLTISFQGLKP
jgi:Domain of unknown function (DUF4406)